MLIDERRFGREKRWSFKKAIRHYEKLNADARNTFAHKLADAKESKISGPILFREWGCSKCHSEPRRFTTGTKILIRRGNSSFFLAWF
jgi:hypothetical protein